MPRRVAIDIAAADPSAAREVVTRALADDPDLQVTVVGPRVGAGPDPDRLSWAPATAPSIDVDPAVAVRGRADLSVRVALELGRDGHVDTVVSASPLAALLTGARFLLRRRTGVRDPLVAASIATAGGDVVVLDVSGHGGTSAGSLVEAVRDLDLPAQVGLLDPSGDPRAPAALSGHLGRDVRTVSAAEVLVGAVPLVLVDGGAGGLFVDTVRALAPDRVGVRRVVGLTDDAPRIVTVGPDPATWAPALAAGTPEVAR